MVMGLNQGWTLRLLFKYEHIIECNVLDLTFTAHYSPQSQTGILEDLLLNLHIRKVLGLSLTLTLLVLGPLTVEWGLWNQLPAQVKEDDSFATGR